MNIILFLTLFGFIVVAGIFLVFTKNIRHSLSSFFAISVLVGTILILNNAWVVGAFLIVCNSLNFWLIARIDVNKKNITRYPLAKKTVVWSCLMVMSLYILVVTLLDINVVLKKNANIKIIYGLESLHHNIPTAMFMMLFIGMVCGIIIIIFSKFNKKIED